MASANAPRRTNQPEWMDFDASKKTEAVDEPSKAPVGQPTPKGPNEFGNLEGVDDIQRFRAMMREQERQAGKEPVGAGSIGAETRAFKEVQDTTPKTSKPLVSNVDSLFAEGGLDSLFGPQGFFDPSLTNVGPGGRNAPFLDLVDPAPEPLFTSPLDANISPTTVLPRKGDGRMVSRFQQLFEKETSDNSSHATVTSGINLNRQMIGDPHLARPQGWMENGNNVSTNKQGNGIPFLPTPTNDVSPINKLLESLPMNATLNAERSLPPPGKVTSEEEIIQQLLASKGTKTGETASPTARPPPQHIPHGSLAAPGHGGRSEEELLQKQIMQQLMGGGNGGIRPPLVGEHIRQGPVGVPVMTEEDILRMQGLNLPRPPPVPPNARNMNNGPPPKMLSEDDVLSALGAPRPRPDPRGNGSPTGSDDKVDMNRVMAMLARSSMNVSYKINSPFTKVTNDHHLTSMITTVREIWDVHRCNLWAHQCKTLAPCRECLLLTIYNARCLLICQCHLCHPWVQ
jgi:hypothetical protein